MPSAFRDTNRRRGVVFLTVDPASNEAACSSCFPGQAFHSHTPVSISVLQMKCVFFTPTRIPPRRHILCKSPQVKCVGVISDYRFTRVIPFAVLALSYLFFMISVEYYARCANDRIFNEFMQIFITLVEYGEMSFRWQIVEEKT